jgi:DNA-binding transcriptional ArsR family regulator
MARPPEEPTTHAVANALRAAGVAGRLEILRAIARAEPMSPSAYVEASGGRRSLREAAYHFRYLRDGGLIELHEVRATGGTAQHFYVLTPIARTLVNSLGRLERAASDG